MAQYFQTHLATNNNTMKEGEVGYCRKEGEVGYPLVYPSYLSATVEEEHLETEDYLQAVRYAPAYTLYSF